MQRKGLHDGEKQETVVQAEGGEENHREVRERLSDDLDSVLLHLLSITPQFHA